LRNPAVMEALLDIAHFWLERGVDGFRLDAVDFFAHDEALRDNPPQKMSHVPVEPYHMQQHLYDLGGEAVLPLIKSIRAFAGDYPDSVMIAEVGSETTETTSLARAGSYVGNARNGVSAAYSLAQMKSRADAPSFRRMILAAEHAFPAGGLVWAFSNHDVARVVTRWGDGSSAAARLFMALLLSLRGAVFIYQGEELGLPEAEVGFESLRDPYGRNHWPDFKGRDGCRTPMPWRSRAKNAGFSRGKLSWLPIPDNHRELAVDVQEKDSGSTLNSWRQFLRLRKSEPALSRGELSLRDAPDPLVVFERRHGDDCIMCIFNLGQDPAELALSNKALAPVWQAGSTAAGSKIQLARYGVFLGRQVNGT
jgi:alpha-glucosidase